MKPWLILCCLASTAGGADAAGFDCLLEPTQTVEIRTSVEGVIGAVHVNRGELVRRGQVLLELQSGVERAAVDSARFRSQMEGQIAAATNRVAYTRKKLERLANLQEQSFVSTQIRDEAAAEKLLAESELQSATEGREMARIELRRAQEQLSLRSIAAPFNGVVVDRLLHPGDLAEAGSGRKPALKVAQIDPVRVDVVLPASMFGQVRVGAKARVSPAVGSTSFDGVVKIVDRLIDAASGTFVARLEVPNPQSRAPVGARCSATIEGVIAPERGKP